jgi:YD repeat-containing protein
VRFCRLDAIHANLPHAWSRCNHPAYKGFTFDLLGRTVRVQEPDGNLRELRYDGEGNVVRAKDQQYDVEFNYTGVNRLLSRTQAGTTVRFVYDTEENLTAIYNEAGAVYRFVLGPTGEVNEEYGFDGLHRAYQRDKAGRVQKVLRPGGLVTAYGYDGLDRVVALEHADGQGKVLGAEKYAYRSDGELVAADNGTSAVKFERDLLGRVVREVVGSDSVASDYGPLGLRTRMRTSRGHVLDIERNVVGDVVGLRAGGGPAAAPGSDAKKDPAPAWEAKFTRDQLGLEIERQLPGGVRSVWRRVWKKYQGKTTKWIWDGNVPVHEWVELDPGVAETPAPEKIAEAEGAGLRQRAVDLAKRAAQGPPVARNDRGSATRPITWVFEPESFAPAAKLVGGQQHAIITDHLGTPTAMLEADGRAVWSADIGIYGDLRNATGDKQACPFRWPGQYEDEETGLYCNRFRYYDSESGEYVSRT